MTYLLQPDGLLITEDGAANPPATIPHEIIEVPHLAPYIMPVPLPKGDVVRIRVAFSCHCFTEAYDAVKHSGPCTIIMDHTWPRVFKQERYDLSLGLPALINGLPGHKVFMLPPMPRREPNYTAFDGLAQLPNGATYRVFFVLRDKRGRMSTGRYRLELFVESAYPTADAVIGMPIKFLNLVAATLKGRPIRYQGA